MDVVELKVTLEDVEPKVKRTLWVPLDIRLNHLHSALQAALGWDNDHLYMFRVGQTTWGEADPDWGGEDLPSNKTSLIELLEDTGVRTFKYLYDFGDGWEHNIRIGKFAKAADGQIYPQLTSIEGRCPPEDIGGPPGYAYFLEVMADKDHPEFEELMEIHGAPFDPSDVEADEIPERIKYFAEWFSNTKTKKKNPADPRQFINRSPQPDGYAQTSISFAYRTFRQAAASVCLGGLMYQTHQQSS